MTQAEAEVLIVLLMVSVLALGLWAEHAIMALERDVLARDEAEEEHGP